MDDDSLEKSSHEMSAEEKRAKIRSNYETIEVLKSHLQEKKCQDEKGITRATYIRVIFDMTRKIELQNSDLGKIVEDTRLLQRDIGSLSGRLERGFILAKDNIKRVC